MLRAVRTLIAAFPRSHPPVAMAAEIHEMIRTVSGLKDPYAAVKRNSNRACREAMPVLTHIFTESLNRFETAVKLAIAGSFIDAGANGILSLTMFDVVRNALRAVSAPIVGDPIKTVSQMITRSSNILFMGDNAGECFLDTFLLDLLADRGLTYGVRGRSVLNDATREDAEAAGIHRRCPIVDTGDNAPGVLLERCSPDFIHAFEEADLLILKGQGNYESFSDIQGKPCVFLTRVKCGVLARDIGYPRGANVVKTLNLRSTAVNMPSQNVLREEVCYA